MSSEIKPGTAFVNCKGPNNDFKEAFPASVTLLRYFNIQQVVDMAVGCPNAEYREENRNISKLDKLLGDPETEEKVFCKGTDKKCIHKYPNF